jgi:hypothetical protein
MEPLNENELEHLLALWVSPVAPRSLEEKLFAGRLPWWQRLLDGIIRRPSFLHQWQLRRRKSIRKA